MHPVENSQRLTQVHQDEPGTEPKELFPHSVLQLRVSSKGRDDPQLEVEVEGGENHHRQILRTPQRGTVLLRLLTIMLEKIRKAQISWITLVCQVFGSLRFSPVGGAADVFSSSNVLLCVGDVFFVFCERIYT